MLYRGKQQNSSKYYYTLNNQQDITEQFVSSATLQSCTQTVPVSKLMIFGDSLSFSRPIQISILKKVAADCFQIISKRRLL